MRFLVENNVEGVEGSSEEVEAWSMDFVADQLEYGRRVRFLPIVDQYSEDLNI